MNAEVIQYVIVGAVVLAAALYLFRLLKPGNRRKKGCCSGCGCDGAAKPKRKA